MESKIGRFIREHEEHRAGGLNLVASENILSDGVRRVHVQETPPQFPALRFVASLEGGNAVPLLARDELEVAADRALSLLTARAAPSGSFEVVLDPTISGMIALECLGSALAANSWHCGPARAPRSRPATRVLAWRVKPSRAAHRGPENATNGASG